MLKRLSNCSPPEVHVCIGTPTVLYHLEGKLKRKARIFSQFIESLQKTEFFLLMWLKTLAFSRFNCLACLVWVFCCLEGGVVLFFFCFALLACLFIFEQSYFHGIVPQLSLHCWLMSLESKYDRSKYRYYVKRQASQGHSLPLPVIIPCARKRGISDNAARGKTTKKREFECVSCSKLPIVSNFVLISVTNCLPPLKPQRLTFSYAYGQSLFTRFNSLSNRFS